MPEYSKTVRTGAYSESKYSSADFCKLQTKIKRNDPKEVKSEQINVLKHQTLKAILLLVTKMHM